MDGWVDGWIGGWMDGWVDGWMGGWMDGWVDAYMHDEYMEGRKDDFGSTVCAICNSRQSAAKTRVQHNVIIPRKKRSLSAAPPLQLWAPRGSNGST